MEASPTTATSAPTPPVTRPRISMRLIIGLATFFLTSLSVLAMTTVATLYGRDELGAEIRSRLLLEARNLSLTSAEVLLDDLPELHLYPLVREMHGGRPELVDVTVLNHADVVVGHPDARRLGTPYVAPPGFEPLEDQTGIAPGEALLSNGSILMASVPVHAPNRDVIGRVLVGIPQHIIDARINEVRQPMVLVACAVLVGGLSLTWLLVGFLLRPLGAIERGLARIGRGQLTTPIVMRHPTELGVLAGSINTMASDLSRSQEEARAKEQEIIDTQKEIIQTLGEVVEKRSKETGNHIVRVGRCARRLALLAGLDSDTADLIENASPMHDVGKISIPDGIINKPDRLTDEEFELVKKHTSVGFDILSKSKRTILEASAIIAHEHHEKWDGSGYPRGLQGEEIHVFGRIVAIADVFDALRSPRAYKPALSLTKIQEIFLSDRGRHFDPVLTDLFIDHIGDFEAIYRQNADDPTTVDEVSDADPRDAERKAEAEARAASERKAA